jgi:PAS domain S-box-containing protein
MQTDSVGRILIVDDEIQLASALREMLSAQGYETKVVASGKEALEALKERDFDLLLTDLMMPGLDGIALLKAALVIDPRLVGIVMTGQGTVQTAVDAMKVGAFDYILKPFKSNVLFPVISRALDMRRLRLENMQLRQTLGIYELGQTISYTLDLNAILGKVADGALQQCDADEASILLPTRDGKELYVAAVRGEGREPLLGQRVSADTHIAGWVATHREPLVLHGKVEDPRFTPFSPRGDIKLSISMPLLVGGKLAGILNLSFTKPRRNIALGELKALSILTAIAGSALESARLHAEVRIAEEKYRGIFENAIEGIFQTCPDGEHFTTANGAMARILGYDSPAELISNAACIGGDIFLDPARHADLIRMLGTKDAVSDFECQWRRRDGAVIWVSFNIHPVRDAGGKLQGYEGTMEDIGERKRAEEAVRSSEARYHTLFEASVDGIMIADSETKALKYANPALCLMLGYTENELRTMGVADIHPRDALAGVMAQFEAQTRKEITLAADVPCLRKDGAIVYADINSVPITIDGTVCNAGFFRDITEHKILQAQLLQAQKMEAVGLLAGGIAHDFNNILTAIIGYGTLLQMKINEGDPLKHNADQVIAAADRAAHLTQSLLAFSRKQIINPKPVDLNQIIKAVEKFLARIIGEDIELKTVVEEEELIVMADSGQVEQLLLNLATNARDAMPEGGLLTVSTGRLAIDADFIKAHGYGKPGPYALICFEDTGIGMDKKVQEKIFEPFFTTKEVGKGTGLGLSIVYGIVKQHNGYINLYSEQEKGTTFRIYFPITQSAVEKTGPREEEAPGGGAETILLGEDDPIVRQLTRTILEQSGYTVIEAVDGEEAVEKFTGNRDKIRLLLLDVVMPKKSGRAVAEEIKKTGADVRVLYTSGYTANVIHRKGILEEGFEIITKPFAPRDLLRKVREVLDQ